jgi:hypothetical protein
MLFARPSYALSAVGGVLLAAAAGAAPDQAQQPPVTLACPVKVAQQLAPPTPAPSMTDPNVWTAQPGAASFRKSSMTYDTHGARLNCEYDNGGVLWRFEPPNMTCSASGAGFVCYYPGPPPAPPAPPPKGE